jgi:glycosyltransferase involved in cell wall biosynthesis
VAQVEGLRDLLPIETPRAECDTAPMMRIAIVMPAYNAGQTVEKVFARIPAAVLTQSPMFIVINDGSKDDTRQALARIAAHYANVEVIEQPVNKGYAQAQKAGFTRALEQGADIVALLHSDGQYAPEHLPLLLEPLASDQCDVVVGSRILGGQARQGGMPLYKYVGNIVISRVENLCFGLGFSEYHSGYMLYSRRALQTIDFRRLSDTFHFDGEMLLMSGKKGLRVKELPVSTCYADEISHLRPIRYCMDIGWIIVRNFLGKYDF